jgi:hypothetical protein
METISTTNFLVCLTNSYCLLRKIRKLWLGGCQSKEARISIETGVGVGLKLCVLTTCQVVAQGVLEKINVHCKNYAVVQNKLAMTLKNLILTITGNSELSKDVLHKQHNFINSDYEGAIYQGKNYGISFIKKISARNVNISGAIKSVEDRFLSGPDKDFLLMIIESMLKGSKV